MTKKKRAGRRAGETGGQEGWREAQPGAWGGMTAPPRDGSLHSPSPPDQPCEEPVLSLWYSGTARG
eukprot:6225351-Alexandrium_andersonii.AAC.1